MDGVLSAFEWNFCPICGQRLELRNDGERCRPFCVVCIRFFYSNPAPAVCCFLTQGTSLLLAQRAVDPCRGQWGLPGGFVEMGETTEDALVREIEEETSLAIRGLHLIGVSTQPSELCGAVTVLGYRIDAWSGTPTPNSDVLAVQFFEKDQRPPLPFRAHRELLAIFDALTL